jgi:AcrR family transcriptional regulator
VVVVKRTDEQGPTRRGRPRDARIDIAVREAARSLLVEAGYANTTMQAIAARAGVGLPTIYRRWPSKAELIEHAVLTSQQRRVVDPDGDFFDELRLFVRGVIRVSCDPVTMAAWPGLIQDLQGDPSVRERYATAIAPSMLPFGQLVANARDKGLIAEDISAGDINRLVTGAALFSMLQPQPIRIKALEKRVFDLVSRAVRPE